jgi:hypothetical protein
MPTIEDFIEAIAVGSIYWFVDPQIDSLEPHPHVCLGINDNDCVFMLCGTSNFEGRLRYFELNGLQFETLVRILPNETNSIKKPTFVDCSEIQNHDVGDLFYNETLTLRGSVSQAELLQIKGGIEISDLLEQVTKNEILRLFPKL